MTDDFVTDGDTGHPLRPHEPVCDPHCEDWPLCRHRAPDDMHALPGHTVPVDPTALIGADDAPA